MNVVGIGGGTGLSVLLRGLKRCARASVPGTHGTSINISAIVSVSDNGGSSGYLRESFGIPAVGDLRNCLVALSDGDRNLTDLFQHRFSGGNGLSGQSLGNLVVTAFFQMSGNLRQATEMAMRVLHSQGRVLPVTESPVALCAEVESGRTIRGESQITAARSKIKKVWLEPESPPATTGVLRAISDADIIFLGPGSLYTSIIPNLLVDGVAQAIRNSHALKIFPCNLMTEPGETDGFTVTDHLRALESYLGAGSMDLCLINSQTLCGMLEERYCEAGSQPVACNVNEVIQMGVVPIQVDLLAQTHAKVRHDPVKIARLVRSLIGDLQRTRDIWLSETHLVA